MNNGHDYNGGVFLTSFRIPDPFAGTNELDVEWVGERRWTYQTGFPSPKVPAGASTYLLFDGLDTFATVQLNGVTILASDNMFLSHRVDVSKLLREDSHAKNTLVIDFDSSLLRAREIQKEHPEHAFIAYNGEPSRLAVRKAQYHWVRESPSSLVFPSKRSLC